MMKSANEQKIHNGRLPPTAVAKSLGELAGDALSLAELQLKLLKSDAQESLHRSYVAIGLLGVGVILLVASLPVALIVTGFAIHELLHLSRTLSFAIALLVGLCFGSLTAFAGLRKLKRSANVFRRSQEEFSDNVAWLKATLKGRQA